jgi:hypothetical protein
MSTKFSRVPRIQPTPAICRRPPIPLPPGAPIETLQAWFEFRGNDYYGIPADFTATATLDDVGVKPQTSYWGRSSPKIPRVEFTFQKQYPDNAWLLIIAYYAATCDTIDTVATLPPSDKPPATGQPITPFHPLPPGAFAQARILL